MTLIGTPALLPTLPTQTFNRVVWHSEPLREKYGEIVREFGNAWLEAEQMSIVEGLRDLCLTPLSQPEYLAFLPWAHDHGLHVRVKRFAGAFQGFANYYTEGSDILVVAMSKTKDYVEDPEPEKYLGYPTCCQTFFRANFPKYIDPVLQWAGNSDAVEAMFGCVPVLRSAGIRFVSHIPCSPQCTGSQLIANKMMQLLPKDMQEFGKEILSMPMSWDCYRGIAIVKTPWFRTIYRSVPYTEKVVVNINAGSEPVPTVCAA